MQLDCYRIYSVAPQIVPGRSRREWMDAFTDRHPYRCLPLTMANSTGWEILCPIDIEIEWNGGELAEAIQFRSSASEAELLVQRMDGAERTYTGIWTCGP